MKKIISTIRKNNKGISLVEILATIAIIAIIAAPLVNSFLNAMKVNSEARIIQNGTAVAQDMAEVFKTFSLESLVGDYTDEGIEVSMDETSGKYTFKDIKVTGADGETFLATVELDPDVYRGGESEKIQVNGVNLPVFSGLFGSDSVMLYRQYAGFDDQLKDLFAGILTETEVVNNRSKFSKTTDVNINCSYNEQNDEYSYSFDIKMTYTYDGNSEKSKEVSKSIKKVFKGEEIHSVYMIAPVFDVYSKNVVISGCSYSTDKINVKYTYTGENPEKKQNLYFYIAEQEINNKELPDTLQKINPANLTVNGAPYNDYIEHNLAGETLKLYTNITDNMYGLTYGEYNTGDSLYQMNITVRLEGQEKTIATFTTTK